MIGRLALAVAAVLSLGAAWAAPQDPAARVGDQVITEEQLVQAMLRRYGYPTLPTLVAREAIRQAAEQAGVAVTDEEVAARIDKFATWKNRHAIITGETFAMYLAREGLTRDLYAEAIRNDLMLEKLIEGRVQVTDQDVAQYYTENAREFLIDEAMRISYIRMSDGEAAQKLRTQIVAGELGFEAAARQYSEDELTKQSGGAYDGWVRRLNQPFCQAAFALQMDADISPVVDFGILGYYIIRRDRYVRDHQLDYEEVRDELKQQLTDGQKARLKENQRRQILEAADTEILYKFPEGSWSPPPHQEGPAPASAQGGGAATSPG